MKNKTLPDGGGGRGGDGSRYNLSREPLDRGGVQASLGKPGGLAQEEEVLLKRGDRC